MKAGNLHTCTQLDRNRVKSERLGAPMRDEVVEIRVLHQSDAHVLDRVDDDVFDHPVQRPLAEQFLASPNNYIAVAIASDVVVGMASGLSYLHPDKPRQFFINEVGVADRMQGRGIGKRLVGRLLDLARTLGCHEAWVATEEGNTAARALYASLHGKEDDDRAVVFTWRLTP
jgi:ribosomal protein S18 acetylase RimI-like enzyme